MGDTSFYGPSKTVNTNSKFIIVTQFITDSGTASGNLKEIRRLYVQNGKVIPNSKVNVPGMSALDSITSQYCSSPKTAFSDTNSFGQHGGLTQIGPLILSIWDDHGVNMLWLDSNYPTDQDPSKPGIARGTCSTSRGVPGDLENDTSISVTYFNIKFGDIGSTYST